MPSYTDVNMQDFASKNVLSKKHVMFSKNPTYTQVHRCEYMCENLLHPLPAAAIKKCTHLSLYVCTYTCIDLCTQAFLSALALNALLHYGSVSRCVHCHRHVFRFVL